METFSALLALCDDRWIPRIKASETELWFSFNLHPNKRLSKQRWSWWFEKPLRSFWRHCSVYGAYNVRALQIAESLPNGFEFDVIDN